MNNWLDPSNKKCSKCGSPNMEYKEGISKKNGRPWSGFKCSDCLNLDFNPSRPKTGSYNAPGQVQSNKDEVMDALRFIAEQNKKIIELLEIKKEE